MTFKLVHENRSWSVIDDQGRKIGRVQVARGRDWSKFEIWVDGEMVQTLGPIDDATADVLRAAGTRRQAQQALTVLEAELARLRCDPDRFALLARVRSQILEGGQR